MINDRGIIKWGAFKLPEHEKLLQVWNEVHNEPEYELTEWELEDLQLVINTAAAQGKIVTLTVRDKSNFINWTGTIKTIQRDAMYLTLDTLTGSKHFPFSSLYRACMED